MQKQNVIKSYMDKIDKKITRHFTEIHYFIMPNSEEPECVQTNHPDLVTNFLLADAIEQGIVEVGFFGYTFYCLSRGLGIIMPPLPPQE